jgi:hypothetical protein
MKGTYRVFRNRLAKVLANYAGVAGREPRPMADFSLRTQRGKAGTGIKADGGFQNPDFRLEAARRMRGNAGGFTVNRAARKGPFT